MVVNDRNGLKWDSAETEASVTFTEASADSLPKKIGQNYAKVQNKLEKNWKKIEKIPSKLHKSQIWRFFADSVIW